MDKYEKIITDIVNKKIKTPSSYQNVIQTTLFNENVTNNNKLKKVLATSCVGIILTSSIVFAGYTIYEKVWKEPIKYDITQEKPAVISDEEKEQLISEDEIKLKATTLLKELGYADKEIKKIDLNRSYSNESNSYYAIYTEDEYNQANSNKNIGININFNAETGDFEYFINNDFDELTNSLEIISKETAIDMAKNTLNNIGYSTDAYEIKSYDNINGNEWNICFSRSYNGIYNRYDEFQINFGVINNHIVVKSINGLVNDKFENNEFTISEEEAKNIAQNKENEFSNQPIINVTAEKSIEKMNTFIYCLENNIEDQSSIKIEDRIRNVWIIKIEHEKTPQNTDETLSDMEYVKEYMSKKYFIDATTGEIIGGEQAKFNLK